MEIPVEEYTSPVLVTVDMQASLDQALELMQENSIRHLPVMDDNRVVGIISERDVLTNFGKSWTSMMKVEDVMATDILTVHRRENLGEVAMELSSKKIGSALVVDDNSEVFGIFTTTDALNALVELLYSEAREKSDLREFEL
jgi:acetoin utilization protein AcuB